MEQSHHEEKNEKLLNGRWTKDQHQKFLEGLRLFGKNWKKIQGVVKSRSGSQIRSHAQKFFNKLERKYQNCQNLLTNQISDSQFNNEESIPISIEKPNSKVQICTSDINALNILAGFINLQTQGHKTNAKKVEQNLNLLKQKNNQKHSFYFDQIWKYPHEIVQKNFFTLLVDLKSKKHKEIDLQDQNELLVPGKRKNSFMMCEGDEDSSEKVNSFQRFKMVKKSALNYV